MIKTSIQAVEEILAERAVDEANAGARQDSTGYHEAFDKALAEGRTVAHVQAEDLAVQNPLDPVAAAKKRREEAAAAVAAADNALRAAVAEQTEFEDLVRRRMRMRDVLLWLDQTSSQAADASVDQVVMQFVSEQKPVAALLPFASNAIAAKHLVDEILPRLRQQQVADIEAITKRIAQLARKLGVQV